MAYKTKLWLESFALAFLLIGVNLANADPIFPLVDPASVGIDTAALAKLEAASTATHSSSVVIVKDGKLVADWEANQQPQVIDAMSTTKSIVDLAIGCLIDSGQIKSVDEPVSDWYPEWNQGRKKQITLRMLLNHTSGLQADQGSDEIDASPDFVQLALCAELSDDPGTKFFYNNKAVNLLSGIIQKVTGERLDIYVDKQIFSPLGITNYTWALDKAGNAEAMAGLSISAIDYAKIAQMMVDGGQWNGKQIVSQSWIDQSTGEGQDFSPNCGLLWWRLSTYTDYRYEQSILDFWKVRGVPKQVIAKAQKYVGQSLDNSNIEASIVDVFGSDDNMTAMMKQYRFKQVFTKTLGAVNGYYADGDLGQYVVVMPQYHLIAVRMITSDENKSKADNFVTFTSMVPDLVSGSSAVPAH